MSIKFKSILRNKLHPNIAASLVLLSLCKYFEQHAPVEGGPGVVPWADGGAHRQLGKQRPGPREQGGGGQERVGDDPG